MRVKYERVFALLLTTVFAFSFALADVVSTSSDLNSSTTGVSTTTGTTSVPSLDTSSILNFILSAPAGTATTQLAPIVAKDEEVVASTTAVKEKSVQDLLQDEKKKSHKKDFLVDFNATTTLLSTASTSKVLVPDDSTNQSGLDGKLKKNNLSKTDKEKLFKKLDALKKKGFSSSLNSAINSLKSNRKQRSDARKNKLTTATDTQTDSKTDFDNLKKINDQINSETQKNLDSTLTPEEKQSVDYVDPNVLFGLEDNIYIPNDPELKNQWDLNAIISENKNIFSTVATLNRPVLVAVIDAGVDYNNPDLKRNMWSSATCVDENNNQISGGCTNGYNFVGNTADPFPVDGFDHGTAVASLIAASTDDGVGMASLSQNRAKIMSLRVADSGIISLDNLTRAVYFAVNNGADIINMSISGPTYSQSLYDALNYAQSKGVVVVVAAGNQGMNLETTPAYPASYKLDNIIVVGSEDSSGAISSFSNYGVNTVDVVAPGNAVWAAGLNNVYSAHTGTSFATPIMSALVARGISEGVNVKTLISKLNANTSYLPYVIGGKTLALSFSNVLTTFTQTQRYILQNDGTYLDTMTKGGTIVPASQATGLASLADSSIGMPMQISPGASTLSAAPSLNSTTQTFYWSPASGAKIYGFYVTDNSTNQSFFYNDNIGTNPTSYTLSGLLPGHTYRWNVGAGKVNISSPYNTPAVWYFKIAGGTTVPTVPTGLAPNYQTSPGQNISTTNYSVSWNQVTGATYYDVYWRDLNTNILYSNSNLTSTNSSFPNLIFGHNYRWNMEACNTVGCSPISVTNYFYVSGTVNSAPGTPTITLPTSVSAGTSANFGFKSVDPDGDAVNYEIKWDANNSINNVDTISSTAQNVLANKSYTYPTAGTYCISSRAQDVNRAYSTWSPCANFVVTTAVPKPDLQVLQMTSLVANTYSPGNIVNYNFTLKNAGTAATAGSYKTKFYLEYANNDTYKIGELVNSTALTAGASLNQNVSLTLPAIGNVVYSGSKNYKIIAVTDADNTQLESNENNNLNDSGIITINIPQTSGASFSISSIGNQTVNTSFPITINTSGIPVGTQINISTLSGEVGNISSIKLGNTGGFTFVYKLSNGAVSQQIILSPVGFNSQTSNSFSVFNVGSAIDGTGSVSANFGGIDLVVTDVNKNPIPNAGVVASCQYNDCNMLTISKTTDLNGKVSFTNSDLAGLSKNIRITGVTTGGALFESNITRTTGANVFSTKISATNVDVAHNPVILIPGIMGSTVGSATLNIPYLDNSIGENNPDPSKLSISDPGGSLGWETLRQSFYAKGYIKNQTIFDCPYDWRFSIEKEAVNYLSPCIEKARAATGGKKVDIVAHSMGGLVTRAYIQRDIANAQKVNSVVFVGTPQLGATDAYYAWEGGNPKDWTTEAIVEKSYEKMNPNDTTGITGVPFLPQLKIVQLQNPLGVSTTDLSPYVGIDVSSSYLATVGYNLIMQAITSNPDTKYALSYRDLPPAKRTLIRKFFKDNNILGIKQLLPTYRFLYNTTTATNTKISNLNNQNEFLIALNKDSVGCLDGGCNEGSYSGGNYNFISLADAKRLGNIATMTMLYGDLNGDNTRYIINVTPSGPQSGFYEDGEPWATGADVLSSGDHTVPKVSTGDFASSLVDPVTGKNVFNLVQDELTQNKSMAHATMMKYYKDQILKAVTGTDSYGLSSATANPNRMNITTTGVASVKITTPQGSVGVDGVTGSSVNTITNSENVNVGANSSTFTLDDPTSGMYTLTLSGQTENDINFYFDYQNISSGKLTAQEVTIHHTPGIQNINFTLATDATSNDGLINLDAKYLQVASNVIVANASGKTKVTFSPALATASVLPTAYALYSKYVNESNFTFVGQINAPTNNLDTMTILTSDDFAGADDTKLKMYRIVSVYADGSNGIESKTYYNNDSDWDGLSDSDEAKYGTNPNNPDTDGDGLPDGVEVYITNTDPTKVDSDGNGIDDYTQNKTAFNLVDKAIAQAATFVSDNFDRAASSTIGGAWTDNADNGDNLKIVNNKLQMQWVNQAWGGFHSIYQNLSKQNDLKISYTWRASGGASVDGYYPYIGVRSSGANDTNSSYGVALYYMPQNQTVNVHVFDQGTLKANIPNVLTGVTTDTDYNVEIIIDKNNFVQFRIWPATGVRPVAPSASWNNAGVAYTPVASGNKLILLTLHGSTALQNITTAIDNLSVVQNIPINTPPTISLLGNATTTVFLNSLWTDPGTVATDTEDGVITGKVAILGKVDTSKVGSTTLIYSVTDTGGITATVQRLVNVVVDPGPLNLLSYYKLDGAVGSYTKLNDEMRQNQPLTQLNIVSPNTLSSAANRFNATDTAVNFAGFGAYSLQAPTTIGSSSVTYSTWFKTSVMGSRQYLLSQNANSKQDYLTIYMDTGSYPTATLGWQDNINGLHYNSILAASYAKSYADGNWHKMDVTIGNSPNATIKIYMDGVLVATNQNTIPYYLTDLKNTLCYGTSGSTCNAYPFWGYGDDLRIYGKELSASDINSEYQKDIALANNYASTYVFPNTISYYKFNGTLGSNDKKTDSITNLLGVTNETTSKTAIDRSGSLSGSYTTSASNILITTPKILTNNAMTYSFWLKGNTISNSAVFSMYTGTYQYLALWISGGKLCPEMVWGSNDIYHRAVCTTNSKNVIDAKWHKIDLSVENSPNATIKTYVDGVLDSTAIAAAPFYIYLNNNNTISLSGNNSPLGYANFLSATYDDFKIYDRALSQSDITNIYNSENVTTALSNFILSGVEGSDALPTIVTDPTPFVPIMADPTDSPAASDSTNTDQNNSSAANTTTDATTNTTTDTASTNNSTDNSTTTDSTPTTPTTPTLVAPAPDAANTDSSTAQN